VVSFSHRLTRFRRPLLLALALPECGASIIRLLHIERLAGLNFMLCCIWSL
jgi:hypothetical protein